VLCWRHTFTRTLLLLAAARRRLTGVAVGREPLELLLLPRLFPLRGKRVPVHTFSRDILVGMMPTHGQAAI
jgi:hypothetical protein